MKNMFLAKIIHGGHGDTEQLIFTDGVKYSPVGTNTLHDFLQTDCLNNNEIFLGNDLAADTCFLPLIEDFQIFATGCTYEWSKEKIISLSHDDVYKKLYLSERSMLFYKGNKNNIATNGGKIGIRPDSALTIPEAEIVAVFNGKGKIIGFTLGNDVTAVDLEKENPLYQMQAKFYKGSAALLPMIKLGSELPLTNLYCRVLRDGELICETAYHSEKFNRKAQEIVDQLMKLGMTSNGGYLFLGCGVSYPKEKALRSGDTVILSADFLPIPLTNKCDEI